MATIFAFSRSERDTQNFAWSTCLFSTRVLPLFILHGKVPMRHYFASLVFRAATVFNHFCESGYRMMSLCLLEALILFSEARGAGLIVRAQSD
jgi:hypothetical protein